MSKAVAAKMKASELFTAAEIGEALGKTRFATVRALAAVAPVGTKIVRNNPAKAWTIESLPAEMLAELEAIRARLHYRSAADVLRDPLKRCSPALPIAEIAETAISKAHRLQRALAAALALPDGTSTLQQAKHAAADYRREFGYDVSERTLRDTIERIKAADRGAREFHRIELYLPKNPPRKATAEPVTSTPCSAFAELEHVFCTVHDRGRPTSAEKGYCWRQIVMTFEERRAKGEPEKPLKRALRDYLWQVAPFLAPASEAAMKRQLERKLSAHAEGGVAALCDGRSVAAAKRTKTAPLWKTDLELLAKWIIRRQGIIAQAYRELHGGNPEGEQFSAPFRERYPFDARTAKSAVPTEIRELVRPMVKAIEDRIKGPKLARDRRPSAHLDWSDTAAGDWQTADDFTNDHEWFEWDEAGDYEFEGRRFNYGRGQLILFCDTRTDLPLYFDLSLNKQPNSRMVFSALSRMWRDEAIGLPRFGANFEQNIFKALKVQALFAWPKIDESFARAGIHLRLRHHRSAKGKGIERVGGVLHRLLNHLPSYVGRDEQHIRYEGIQAFCQSFKGYGQPLKVEVDPREKLKNKEEFADEIRKALEIFADEPQNGERLAGLSPKEAWSQLLPNTPRHVLPESLAYLICTEKSVQTVSHEGVRVRRLGGGWNQYKGSDILGSLRGEKVELYFNPEVPEHVTVIHRRTDPAGVKPFSVPLLRRMPATTATAADFSATREQQKAFSGYGISTWRKFCPPRTLTVRDERLGPDELRERGEQINALDREQIDLRGERQRYSGKITDLASRLNVGINPGQLRDLAGARADLEDAARIREKIVSDAAIQGPSAVKIYDLAQPALASSRKQLEATYWKLRHQVEAANPQLAIAALTHRTLGAVVPAPEQSAEQLAKMIKVFSAIARKVPAKT
jgi:hypothetical protein